MLIVTLTEDELRHYQGPGRSKIHAQARAEARKRGEKTIRVVRPNGSMIEQILAVTAAPDRPVERRIDYVGLSSDVVAKAREGLEQTAQRQRDKRPTKTYACRSGRHFGCTGTVPYVAIGQTEHPCQCYCHKEKDDE